MSIREEIYILHFQLSIFNFELSTDLKESQLQFRFFAHHVLVPLGFENEIDGGGGYAVDGFHLLAHIFHDEVGCRTVGGSQRHVDGGFSLVGDVYFVNQSQVVYIYRYFRDDLHAVLLAGARYDVDAAEGFDGALEQFVGLKAHDQLVFAVDVAGLVRGDGRNGLVVQRADAVMLTLLFEGLEAEVPDVLRSLGRSCV